MSNKISRSGIFYCLCGPAGVGKSVLAERLLAHYASTLKRSISFTSRAPRLGEKQAEAYHFVSAEEFSKRIAAAAFFEWEQVHGNYYGTELAQVQAVSRGEHDLLLVIDIKGALRFKTKLPAHSVLIFLVPPSSAELERRMRDRGEIDPTEIQTRLATWHAEAQIVRANLGGAGVDYIVVNQDLEQSFDNLCVIVEAERARASRYALKQLDQIMS